MSSTAFPRGGAAPPLGRPTAAAQHKKPTSEQDTIFGSKRLRRIEVVDDKSKNKKLKSAHEPAKKLSAKLNDVGLGMVKSSANSKSATLEPISFSKYVVGVQALGIVLHVYDTHALISLPGGKHVCMYLI